MKNNLVLNGKSRIELEILSYLLTYPKSRDTLDGIVEWWLLERKIKYQIDIVKKALKQLISKHFILEYKGQDERIHYRINQQKYEEVKSFAMKISGDMNCRRNRNN